MSAFDPLPSEVIVHIYAQLEIPDRLALARTCSLLHREYTEAATLQYDFHLTTTAYLDVPNQPPVPATLSPIDESAEAPVEDPTTNSYISPHTGKLRTSIPSVKYCPFPEEPVPRPLTEFISPAEKVKLLKEREGNWDTLTPKKIRTLSVEGSAGVYELQEGIFLMCDDYVEQREVGLTRSQRPFSIRLIPLPSSSDPDLEDPIVPCKSTKLKFPLSDLTMDPTQDLIVASEFIEGPAAGALGLAQLADHSRKDPTHKYHLLSLSTFEPHPLAVMPILDFPPTSQLTLQTRQLLQIMGDTLVILVSRFAAHWLLAGFGGLGTGNDEEIVCWNWKTGKVLARMALPENGWFSSLSVLSPTSFMITSTANISPVLPTEPRAVASVFPPVIQIYSFAPDPARDITPLQPLDLEHVDDTTPRPVLVAQLHVPPAAEGAVMGSFDVRPDPAFPPTPKGDAPMLGPRKPFTQDPSKGVLVFELQLGDPPPDGEGPDFPTNTTTYELFVLREYLVRLATEGEERLRRSRLPASEDRTELWDVIKTFQWSEWGLQNSRFLTQTMPSRHWVCSCSGYRYISLVDPDDAQRPPPDLNDHNALPPRPQDLLMLDFSPYAVKRARSKGYPATSDLDRIDIDLDRIDDLDHDHDHDHDLDHDIDSNNADKDEDGDEGEWTDDDMSVDDTFIYNDSPYQTQIQQQRRGESSSAAASAPRFTHDPLELDVIDDLSCIEMGNCWAEDIWSGLPYVRIRKEMGIVASGVMIDDQRVMMLSTENETTRRAVQKFTVLCM